MVSNNSNYYIKCDVSSEWPEVKQLIKCRYYYDLEKLTTDGNIIFESYYGKYRYHNDQTKQNLEAEIKEYAKTYFKYEHLTASHNDYYSGSVIATFVPRTSIILFCYTLS